MTEAQFPADTFPRQHARTRRFYKGAGYPLVATLRDFYAPRDHKLMFCKVIRARI